MIIKRKWIGFDTVHLVVSIQDRLFYTDVKSTGTNFTLVGDLEIYKTDLDLQLTHDQLKEIEETKWSSDLQLVNHFTGLSYSVSQYKAITWQK